jgi:hypothetical protein
MPMTATEINRVFCFFEQSGTFKNEFIKLGIPAEDYDIQNEFGETDHVIDLFEEIESAYRGGVSVFDSITCNDLIIAFFPCIYFCAFSQMQISFDDVNYKKYSTAEKTAAVLQRSENREYFFRLLVMLFSICMQRGLRLIVENPWSQQTFLKNNFILPPSFVDNDRTARGDYFIKPTAYWFVNCEPTNGFTLQRDKEVKKILNAKHSKQAGICSTERSMISHDYARNFICDKIIGKQQKAVQKSLFDEI